MSSKIKVDQIENSSGSGDVAFTGTNGIKLSTIKSSGGTTAMTIDSGGRTIINNATRPRFEAGFTNDDNVNVGSTNNTDYRITFTQEIVDIGGCWNNNHTFVAPVNGLYMFYGNLFTTYTSNNSRTGIALYVDSGSGVALKFKNWSANWETETTAKISMPIYLSATNTVDIRMSVQDSNDTGNTFQIYRNTIYSNFGGYLIG